MNKNRKCLLCYQPLDAKETPYHARCAKKFFGKSAAPLLPYRLQELDKRAKEVIRNRVTVPGVQAKLSLHWSERGKDAGRLTLVGLWGNYILKAPVNRFPQIPEIEDLTMHLAGFFKIDTVPHTIIPLRSGELAYITRRIDRDRAGNKLHMEDMCQLTGRLTEDKYKGSMEQAAKVIHQYTSNPGLDALRFFEVTLFSFLTGNADMHLKNFSLIRDERNFISLTPAYDMLATRLLISIKEDSEELALTLNGKKSNFKQTDFYTFAETIGLSERQVKNIFTRFSSGVRQTAAFIDQSFLSSEMKLKYKKLIQKRAARLSL